jgi:hypothetical protein
MAQSRNTVVALCLVALVFAAASLPAATAFGCYDDCYERCANGKQDPACVKMCNEACGADAAAKAAAGASAAKAPAAGASA